MKCPKCQEKMEEQWDMVTNNGKRGKEFKEYKKVVYWCKKDDIWLSIETPSVKSWK